MALAPKPPLTTGAAAVSGHSFFAPSASHRWINCPGSMAYPENQGNGGSTTYADDGSASHMWAAMCLKSGQDAEYFLGTVCPLNGHDYEMDEERAAHVQLYLDDVRRRALGGHLLVEHWVNLAPWFGPGQGGTSDVVIIQPSQRLLIIEDLKYGMGERVFAAHNAQLLCYALGALADAELICDIDDVLLVVNQPRLNHIDEWGCTVGDVINFRTKAMSAIDEAGHAMVLAPGSSDLELYLNPDQHTCRWCRAKTRCTKLAKVVAEEVRADFDTIAIEPPVVPAGTEHLSRAMIAIPLIEDWCRAVKAEVHKRVSSGQQIMGPDEKPMKYVAGDEGKREWIDEKAAEQALVGQLGPKAYKPQEPITAPAAAKLLDKKATKNLWKEIFVPMIHRKPGRPQLALGSDPRPAYTGAAESSEFDAIGSPE